MEKIIKDDFVRVRINKIEKQRLENLTRITCRKRSDIYRDAIYQYMAQNYPECLEVAN